MHHSFKNLVVAATGTGKTVIAAFDYRDFCKANPTRPNKLLFVAHRKEILSQSLACFRGILKDLNFGSTMVGGSEAG
nr:DEAD/DEAH box helicase family protein [Desulfosporosinus nitroreducens]